MSGATVLFVINVVVECSLFIVGLVLAIKAIRTFSVAGRFLRRPTLRVSELREGPVELAGKVVAVGEALVSLSGHRCVAVTTIVSGQSRSGDDSTGTGSRTRQLVVPARLTDATGHCRLDLGLSDYDGERWLSKTITEAELPHVPWLDLVPPGSTEVTIEERIVPEGATVLVSGDAAQETNDTTAYREGKATEWVISGTAQELLLLSVGGQTRLLARTLGVATFLLAVAGYLLTLGGLIITLAFTL